MATSTMRTVGEILKRAREEKSISLDEVVAATKIKKAFLESLEADDFQKISSVVSVRGFIKNYAEFLGLSSRSVLAVFRRDFNFIQEKEAFPGGFFKRIGRPGLHWSPKTTLILVIFMAFFALSAYLGYQYFSLIRKPSLELLQPQAGQQMLTGEVGVVGKADPDSTVTVNGHLVSLTSIGEFHFTLTLLPGENKVVVEATNRLGKKSRTERIVFIPIQKDRESDN